ncbi:tRNA delta(2)-isopentenylpyrophosphate transferase [Prochlorococcus marinus str. MIT 9312]|uniref:tRNA dimethylallyltransferase n=1 Tax=Prochlorococcus marinus (strain MIT 9312) TaxID=74546 RepID=MIAA_PROM9|nr:tRNA (adenosine(37)-N6)-dimethylallyltransferase MiaA [Prochlorococcus marinus]Q318A6.1 RecName: Full=tRNA dimethylallyltransferase; AltName: Full=Dimethylallyl diphosphate:tRNA dimethylallyltransferase; Short=DMAPP:tRNA dimethylallyltransferase; Short=DMATase; AltName: Full=Isopentenyl-diphosphate:tRNA isopentenyltransferase; Short=IPP transferase; Short=IPPT; Short=IPTase [Prochlorococcus marinus str. MIT 9312]ABB50789.1 tRNA delta(2)-isopentenylpyrophosphate transferase [Prochlorococcus mar
MSSYPPHVIVLIGATASGKTELAIEIAEYFKTRIHNIDSRQIYKSMDIGTAKPSENQQKKIKHFLIDIEEPINPINVKQFQEIAQKSIQKEIKQNNLPLLVGGSGLYMNAITKGFFVPDVPPQNNLREQLEELGQKECWELLKNCDPISAKKINLADQIRTIRALEVFYVTGKPLSSQKVQKPPQWKILELGLNRDNLKERISRRTKNMFLSGIIEETKNLISRYGSDLPILETIGYREAKDVLNNNLPIDKAIELTNIKTNQFAKRQKTWFRNKNNPIWLNNKNLLKDAIIKIESFLD